MLATLRHPRAVSVMMALSALSAASTDSCNAVDCECYCCPPWMGSAVMCGVAASIFNFRSGNESACTSTACTERYPDGCPDLTNVGGHPTPHRATYSETPVCLDRPQCETVNCECYCCPEWMGSATRCGAAASYFNFFAGAANECTKDACHERYPDSCPLRVGTPLATFDDARVVCTPSPPPPPARPPLDCGEPNCECKCDDGDDDDDTREHVFVATPAQCTATRCAADFCTEAGEKVTSIYTETRACASPPPEAPPPAPPPALSPTVPSAPPPALIPTVLAAILVEAPPPAPPPALSPMVLAAILVPGISLGALLVALASFLCYVRARERQGTPIWSRYRDTEKGAGAGASSASSAETEFSEVSLK